MKLTHVDEQLMSVILDAKPHHPVVAHNEIEPSGSWTARLALDFNVAPHAYGAEPSLLKTNNFRFLEKIDYILPGVELIAQANLNVEDDPYLLDHNWKGSLLFPFVFGFEAR